MRSIWPEASVKKERKKEIPTTKLKVFHICQEDYNPRQDAENSGNWHVDAACYDVNDENDEYTEDTAAE